MKSKPYSVSSLFLLLLTCILTGCASITYEEPKTGPLARVRFATDSKGVTIVRSYSSKACEDEQEMMRLRNGFVLFSHDSKRLGIPLWNYHNNAAKEFFIRANIPQVYMFESAQTRGRLIHRCGVFIQQLFEEGKDYEVSYKWHSSACRVEVYEINKNTLGNVEKILLQEKDSKLLSDFSKACLDQFYRVRWY